MPGGELLALSDMLGDVLDEAGAVAWRFAWTQLAGVALITSFMNRRLGPAPGPVGVLILARWLAEVALLFGAVLPITLVVALHGWGGVASIVAVLALVRAGLWHLTLTRLPRYGELPTEERAMGLGACVLGSLSFDAIAALLVLPSFPLTAV